MVRSQQWLLRSLAIGMTTALVLAACGGTTPSTAPVITAGPGITAGPTADTGPKAGGTIYVLTHATAWNKVDPQRIYTGEDLAFFGATLQRSLLAYKLSADPTEGTSLTPDMATDLGTASDGGKTWSFTLRDGLTWQDGSEITCADVAYGVSRTFSSVIKGGPTYAKAYLDIPSGAYKGPYAIDGTVVGQDLFDKAVVCEGKKITFHLSAPVADFNYTTTLGFAPVPKAADTGETYGTVAPFVMSSGPYQVESYTTGNGGKMILVRNPNWKPASDPYRKAYPDRWEIHFGIDEAVLDQRIMKSSGNDAFTLQYGGVLPENLVEIFADTETPTAAFAGRAVSGFDPYTSYYWIDVNKVPNVKIRQAMAVALDREGLRKNIGGAFAGGFADGAIKPNIGADYAPTGLWDTFFGKKVADSGDPELAKSLIAESNVAAPTLRFNFSDTVTGNKNATIVIDSLGKAGITVIPAPVASDLYYTVIFDPATAGDFGVNGWGADWPNASTVIPPLFTQVGGWDVSQLDDPAYNAKVAAALTELDRPTQAKLWQALNTEAAQNMYIIPTFFGLSQTIAGSKVGPIYRWPAYGSWPYAAMYVVQ